MNNKLDTAVLCYGSHICKQSARIRVKTVNVLSWASCSQSIIIDLTLYIFLFVNFRGEKRPLNLERQKVVCMLKGKVDI
jgi:hypothetical protein